MSAVLVSYIWIKGEDAGSKGTFETETVDGGPLAGEIFLAQAKRDLVADGHLNADAGIGEVLKFVTITNTRPIDHVQVYAGHASSL